MQALYNYFETWTDQGIEEFRMEVKKLPGGTYAFRLSPMGRPTNPNTTVEFAVTRMGMSPLDNRRIYN